MSSFNLTFKGQIETGETLEEAKLRFGKLFDIDDPGRIEDFFSGETLVILRDLDRKTAAQYFQDMRKLGLIGELVSVNDRDKAQHKSKSPGAAKKSATGKAPPKTKKSAATKKKVEKEEKEEKRRLAAEEKARKQAALEAQRQKEAEEKARKQAELEIQRQKEAEEKARKQAQLEVQRRKEAEDRARKLAEQEARQREEAEEQARKLAQMEEQRRRESEERKQAQVAAEKKRREEARERARLLAKLEAEREHEARERARLQAEIADIKRKEEQRAEVLRAELAAREPATPREPETEARPEKTDGRKAKPRLRTALDLPRRDAQQPKLRRRQQPGEPNLYQLNPFRNSPEVRSRAARARTRMRQGLVVGLVALGLFIVVTLLQVRSATSAPAKGAAALLIDPAGGLALLADNRLFEHDRAGIGTGTLEAAELGLSRLAAPAVFNMAGELLVMATPLGEAESDSATSPRLTRCNLEQRQCQALSSSLGDLSIDALAVNPVDGSLLLADANSKQLVKLSTEGEVIARANVPIAVQPHLRINAGLLFMNSAQGPAISVFRYDQQAFGEQLDEILIVPPPAVAANQTVIGDFLWSGDNWWVSIGQPDSDATGLYRYDLDWNHIEPVTLPSSHRPLQLASWGDKTLVNDRANIEILRFNTNGELEAPLASTLLSDWVIQQQRRAGLTSLGLRSAFLLLGLTVLASLGFAYIQRLRCLVYKTHKERGAEPIEDLADELQWIPPAKHRPRQLQLRLLLLTVFVLVGAGAAISQGVSALQLAALLLAGSGPIIALLLIIRRPTGNIGLHGQRLLLADHRGMYHMGEGSRIHHRGAFLLIDDVLVFTGNWLLPAFSSKQLRQKLPPLLASGVRVDSNTILVKLLQGRHPLALGALTVLGCTGGALVVLGLQGIF